MIPSEEYPDLIEFMRKCLFQLAAPTFVEAIGQWKMDGTGSVRAVIENIDQLIASQHSKSDIDSFVEDYSDYGLGDGLATLEYIRQVLMSSD